MTTVAVVEFVIILMMIVVVVLLSKISRSAQEEIDQLKLDVIKAKSEASYNAKLMELKDEAYRTAKEENRKIDEGNKRDRIAAAGSVLCDD